MDVIIGVGHVTSKRKVLSLECNDADYYAIKYACHVDT